jgi:hypothetical protein
MRNARWCTLALLVLATPALATWRQASTDKFIVYSDGAEKDLVEFVERADKFDQVLRLVTGFKGEPSPVKVRIYLVDSDQTVRRLHPWHLQNLAGFYNTTLSGGIGVAVRTRAFRDYQLDGETVLCHEYVHYFMAQYFPFAYPHWYQEGVAELFANTQFEKNGHIRVGASAQYRMYDLFTTAWLGTSRLMQDTGQLSVSQVHAFYAESWLLAHYFFENEDRAAQLREYLQMRNHGVGHVEALQKAFGLTDSQFDQQFRAYFDKRRIGLIEFTSLKLVTPAVSVQVLPPSADALLLPDLRLELGVADGETKALLETVRSGAARFHDDDAQLTLARAEARYGDHDRAARLLDELMAKDPANRRALLELALLQLSAKEPDATARLAADRSARTLAVRANRLAHDDPEALFFFYQSFAHEPAGPSKNAVDGLAGAYANLPLYVPVATSYVDELLRAHDTAHAVQILRRIAYAPHGGESAQRAQARLKEIEDQPAQETAATNTDKP